MREALLELQSNDDFVKKQAEAPSEQRSHEAALWTTGKDGLLRRKGAIYVPESALMQAELLATHHNDPYAGHFGFA